MLTQMRTKVRKVRICVSGNGRETADRNGKFGGSLAGDLLQPVDDLQVLGAGRLAVAARNAVRRHRLFKLPMPFQPFLHNLAVAAENLVVVRVHKFRNGNPGRAVVAVGASGANPLEGHADSGLDLGKLRRASGFVDVHRGKRVLYVVERVESHDG